MRNPVLGGLIRCEKDPRVPGLGDDYGGEHSETLPRDNTLGDYGINRFIYEFLQAVCTKGGIKGLQ